MAEPPLRVMIADQDPGRARVLASVLAEAGYAVVAVAEGDTRLPTLVETSQPDVVLVNTDSPSRDTLEQLTTLNENRPRPVVMFARDEARETIRAAVRAGISAYVTQGLDTARVAAVIETARAQFQQHQGVRDELARVRQTLAERKTLDQAKGLIMQRRGCSEAEAFKMLRQAAMNHKKRLGQVAEEIVQAASLLQADTQDPRGARA